MSPKVCFGEWLELPISFCAKNASTTTIRIGNAALLKNLLIRRKCGARRAWTRSLGLPSVASGQGPPNTCTSRCSLAVHFLQLGHEGQVAVALGVVQPVPDHEPVGNLESHILRM